MVTNFQVIERASTTQIAADNLNFQRVLQRLLRITHHRQCEIALAEPLQRPSGEQGSSNKPKQNQKKRNTEPKPPYACGREEGLHLFPPPVGALALARGQFAELVALAHVSAAAKTSRRCRRRMGNFRRSCLQTSSTRQAPANNVTKCGTLSTSERKTQQRTRASGGRFTYLFKSMLSWLVATIATAQVC